MSASVEYSALAERVNEDFKLKAEVGEFDLRLIECGRLTPHPGSLRDPFSLIFRGPAAPVLPQRTYPLDNPHTGPLEIFIVPIGRDAAGVLYQAVFN